jgi:hypothetical protein
MINIHNKDILMALNIMFLKIKEGSEMEKNLKISKVTHVDIVNRCLDYFLM